MDIIIVGCGKVGYTLVENLNGENHNIVVIDENEEKVKSITDDLDAMGIVGNGVSYQTLKEAGIYLMQTFLSPSQARTNKIFSAVSSPEKPDTARP